MASASPVDFQRDVWPILEKNCVECHGPKKQKSSLRVDSRAALLKGGEIAPALVAGDPGKSYLLELVTSKNDDDRMPRERDPLTKEQIATLRQWIVEGAIWPGDAASAPAKKHWAYEPVTRPDVPNAKGLGSGTAAGNPIDAFIVARLATQGLQMSSEADPRTFIRRATLDLTGLPPTPEEVQAFVRECETGERFGGQLANAAVARLVDRLLASPRYGERWAQHWLDVIRYAETSGYENNAIRPGAWPYRDYVVMAFNQDIPYPRFILEQLAGDTLGADAATGFLVTAPFPLRTEIGQEASAIAQSRFNGIDEVLQNIGSALLGTTVGCARCHDHKFDPVSTRDYYRLAATFAGVHYLDRPWKDGARPDESMQSAERELAEIKRELRAFPTWRETGPTGYADLFQPVRAKFVRLSVIETFFNRKYAPAFGEIEVWNAATEERPSRNVGSAREGAVARSSGSATDLGSRDTFLNDGVHGWKSLWISNSQVDEGRRLRKGEAWVEIELAEPTVIDRVVWSCDFEDQGSDVVPLRWRLVTNCTVEVAEEPGQWRTVVSESRADELAKPEQDRRKKLEQRYAVVAKTLAERGQIFAGRFRSPPQAVHVLVRGDPLQPREVIGSGAIDVMGSYELPVDAPEPARRAELGKWLGGARHPLTARVFVNRIWRHHFGAGIVETPGDFGTQGERPSHPELLDWLASEFIARGWRAKELHRLICTSAAYRQDSRPQDAATRIDADARLLWRFPPRRMEAEAIRDGMLFASGSLDLTMGGPGVNVFEPRANPVHGEWIPQENPGPASWRRAIYLMRMRGADDGLFKPFDVPDCGQVRAKRGVSTTPLQALNLFNSAFVVEQAARLAARVEREAGADRGAQIERVFELVFARRPAAAESAACRATAEAHGLSAVCRALLNSNEFLFIQ